MAVTLEGPAGALLDRADRAITAALQAAGHAVSRSWVQRALDEGLVRVADVVVGAKVTVRAGQTVELPLPRPALSELTPDAGVKVPIVYQDEHLVVVDKPAGLVVHPAKGNWEGTLVHGLLALGLFDAELTDEAIEGVVRERPGIVHRLDKGTSGLLVVARDATTREGLKRLFAAHDITREYVAIAVGDTAAATFDTPHGRHPRDRTRFTSFAAGALRRAITHVEVIERLAGATLVRCRLETGRTHQIRIHLAERAKTPILGDPLYGVPPKGHVAAVARALGHQALHARVLGFVHPRTGRTLRFESEPPEDFQAARAALGGR